MDRIGVCIVCSVTTDPEDGEFCFVCDDLPDVCANCMGQHLTDNHTQIEFMLAGEELCA